MDATYDSGNIFAKILRGEIPCHRAYEDDDVLAFMDVMPQCDGHTLVIPKAPSRNLFDADPAVLGRVIVAVQKIAKGVVAAFAAEGVRILQFNEPAAGQSVFHLHFHILPMTSGTEIAPHATGTADHARLAAQAAKLRAALGLD